jgi:hypothetical protein
MKKYYVVGVGYKDDDVDKKNPYEIWVDAQDKEFPIVILEGKGMGGVGGRFRPGDLLKDHWKELVFLTESEWLIPLCAEAERRGEELDIDSVIESYKYKYNSSPVVNVK